ncbi:MAG: bifunctional sterol desaturase/short chain dehydrogenase [Kamptonema sp. SIO1D9]|nr:bifunctional sterol desaturase/short chain dehydrogenase [Kamptonema sp. SIO1D9]
MIMEILIAITTGLSSVFWVELVRDSYHVLGHVLPSLYRLHVWHHRVFRPDLSVVSDTIYRKAHWYNDVPEALVMLLFSLLPPGIMLIWGIEQQWTAWAGTLYTIFFLLSAIARGLGIAYADELTDLTHRPGSFTSLPGKWLVNRSYHWRHHFDNQNAYYCGTFTFIDKIMGTAVSLKGKTVAITGASGTLGKSLIQELRSRQAKVIALTSSGKTVALTPNDPVKTIIWQVGQEAELASELEKVDILIINHGINVHGDRKKEDIALSYEVNTFSAWRLIELFFTTVKTDADKVTKEVWVNTSEAEVGPAFSPLYELTKRSLGDIVTLKRLDAPCVVRKLILGPFKSNLNPIGVMSSDWVAKQIINLAVRDFRDIIVTINPLTFIAFPLKEICVSTYFKLFTNQSPETSSDNLPEVNSLS